MKNLQWNKNHTRYELITESSGALNWLFLPGGAGMDSSYMHGLIQNLELPGKCWSIDFLNNGSNMGEPIEFLIWKTHLVDLVKLFENVIIVGHSFGAMLALMTAELGSLPKGFIAMNSSPVNWLPARAKLIKKTTLPILTDALKKYRDNPTETTFREFYKLSIPHLVTARGLTKGYELLKDLPYNFKAYDWWISSAATLLEIRWLPSDIPILIICGSEDTVTPPYLFKDDLRFKAENIEIVDIPGGSHLCWIEEEEQVHSAFHHFVKRIHYKNTVSVS
jgi:pimeloyl-ACP methyl ester carboxylesterase